MPFYLLDNEYLSASYTGTFPDKLKLKKSLGVWPLEFKYTATWDRHAPVIEHRFSCKDQIFRGKFSISNHALEYRKRFALAGLGQSLPVPGSLVLGAHWSFAEGSLKPVTWKPAVRVGVELLRDNWEYRPPSGLALKPKFFITKHLGFQTVAKAHVQLPQSLQFDINSSQPAGGSPLMSGGASVHLDFQELNLVLRV